MTARSFAGNGGWSNFREVKGDVAIADSVSTDLIDILDIVDVPIIVVRRDTTIACFNRAAAEVFGIEISDIGRSPREIVGIASSDLDWWGTQVIDAGAPFRHEFRAADRSFVVRIAPYVNRDTKLAGAVLTFTNVTAFRASIDQAIYEREFTKAIVNTIADPLVVLRDDLKVQSANRAFYEMLGVSREEAQGVSLCQLGNGAFDLEHLRTQLQEMLIDGRAFQPCEVYHAFHGIDRTIMLDARLFSSQGNPNRMFLLAFHDITTRKQAEAANLRLAAIVEFSDDAILTKSLDGIITSWNSGAERIFGYTADEVIGMPVTMLIPVDRHDEEPKILARIRRGERVDHYETIRQRKDGSLVDISLTISPVRDRDGAIIGASTIAREITERRRAEEQTRLLLREMDHRVKNLFALAGGVVALSARSASSAAELSSNVQNRLSALARAHALTLAKITDDGRRMEQSTTLHAVIHTIVAPYEGQTVDGKERVTVSGADIPIGGGSLTSLALLLNEFATNAAKYGALSTPTGRIDIECHEDGAQLILAWTEGNGPAVDPLTNGEGFGTKLARATVQAQLGGEISRDWNPVGLRIRLSIPRDRISA